MRPRSWWTRAAAFKLDIDIRTAESKRSPDGIRMDVVEIAGGYRWNDGDTEVLTFDVDHHPIKPAFGFRINRLGKSVALSGDTRYSENLIRNTRGVDLLIHEVVEATPELKARMPNLQRIAHHTKADEAGRVFTAVAPKLAVYSHLVLLPGITPADLIPLTRATYSGPLRVGEDLMSFHIGDGVTVHEPPGVRP